ncbi:hypothetical protein C1Y63_01455 [Corynebacterium sp. 13CS0277]|nr:DUF6542 domain-containing protein [Corynebacterium sp. 13CS0277]PRQ12256.1 hypothetical protein C1Y63_01455 [Corynebacterium sp. 13CS0277]
MTSIQAAALVTGLVLSVVAKDLGAAYLVAFALGAFATTLLVEARGLFLTVAQVPILFAIVTPVAGWLVQNSTQPEGKAADFSTTGLLTAVFPVATFFPVLLAVTLGCVLLGTLRYITARRRDDQAYATAVAARKRMNDSDRENVETTSRVRARTRRALEDPSRQVTVDELLKKRSTQPTSRRLHRRSQEQRAEAHAEDTRAADSTGAFHRSEARSADTPHAEATRPRRTAERSPSPSPAPRAEHTPQYPTASAAGTAGQPGSSAGSSAQRSARAADRHEGQQLRRTYIPRSDSPSAPTPGAGGGSYRRPQQDTTRRVVRPPQPREARPADRLAARPQVRRTEIPRDTSRTGREATGPRRVQQPPQPQRRNPFLDDDLFDA